MNRKKKVGGTEIAFRPQTIIEARYDLDRRQNDIIDILLGIVGEGNDTEENTRYEINISDVKHLYNLQDESNAYAYLQKAVKKFEGLGFRLKEDEGTDVFYPWFSKIKYQKKRGDEGRSKIVLDLHPEVKQMIMSAKQGAYYRIEYPLNLTKKYSKRLYYLLKDRENFNGGTFVISFQELRKMMKVPDSYANGNVKREILDKPYEEINGNTDIAFEYQLIYEKLPSGQQSIGAVQFKVQKLKPNKTVVEYETIEKNGETVTATEEEQEIIDVFSCSVKEARDILKTAKANNRTREQLFEILTYTLRKQVDNKVGYVLTILKNGYNEPTRLSGKESNSWNNKDLNTAYCTVRAADPFQLVSYEKHMNRLELTNIKSAYGRHQVLTDVNLTVQKGQIIGIVGANGCGKSTLLQILAGLRLPDEGNIYLDGQQVKGRAGRSLLLRYTGYVPQESNLIPEISVGDNLFLWYRNKHKMKQELESGFLHTMGIDKMYGIKAEHLSGGMKKRVSIGCALADSPVILLLDEPNAALDLPGKEQLREYFLQYQKMGGTVILATHDEGDLEICDKVYVLRQGCISEIDRTLRGKKLVEKL